MSINLINVKSLWPALPPAIPNGSPLTISQGDLSKLKLLKRQMYGFAKVELLRARLMATG